MPKLRHGNVLCAKRNPYPCQGKYISNEQINNKSILVQLYHVWKQCFIYYEIEVTFEEKRPET